MGDLDESLSRLTELLSVRKTTADGTTGSPKVSTASMALIREISSEIASVFDTPQAKQRSTARTRPSPLATPRGKTTGGGGDGTGTPAGLSPASRQAWRDSFASARQHERVEDRLMAHGDAARTKRQAAVEELEERKREEEEAVMGENSPDSKSRRVLSKTEQRELAARLSRDKEAASARARELAERKAEEERKNVREKPVILASSRAKAAQAEQKRGQANVPFYDRLYKRNAETQRKLEEMREAKRQAEAAELKAPEISERSRRMKRGVDEYKVWQARREQRLAAQRAAAKEATQVECTFKPVISDKSSKLTAVNGVATKSVVDRLTHDVARRKDREAAERKERARDEAAARAANSTKSADACSRLYDDARRQEKERKEVMRQRWAQSFRGDAPAYLRDETDERTRGTRKMRFLSDDELTDGAEMYVDE